MAWPVSRLDRRVYGPAVSLTVLLLVVSARYGFHRDELYFIESAKHPAWGYIDNPSLTPMIGWLSRRLFGDSLFGLRVIPALEAGLIVVCVSMVARELGGERRAQLLTAVITATAGFIDAIGHLLTTPTFDVLISTVLLVVLVRIARTGDHRWWLAAGAAIGVALENKYTIVLLVLSLAAGVIATRAWSRLWSPWLLAAVGIAVVLALPQLLWQIHHDWPQLSFARALARNEGGENRGTLIPFQFVIIGPPLAPLLVAGWWSLARRPVWTPIRFIAVGYLVLLALLLVTGGKGYYAAGLFGVLIPSAAIALVDWIDRSTGSARRLILAAGIVVNAVVGAIVTLPILSASAVDSPIGALNEDAKETIGWPTFVDQVAAVAATVPADERANLVIFTSNYGEAGAIDRYGASRGLGPAYSGHNSYADFRVPSGSDGPVLVVGYAGLGTDSSWFTDCRQAATVHTIDDIDNQVNGNAIWLCTAPQRPWASLWPDLRHEG